MQRPLATATLLALAIASVLAGCTDGDDDRSETSAATAADRITTAAPTTAPFIEAEPGCLDLVDAVVPRGLASSGDGDAVWSSALDGTLALPPVLDGRRVLTVQTERFADADEFLRKSSKMIEAEERRQALAERGFAGAIDVDLAAGADLVSVLVLRFASHEDAVAYQQLHLRRACEQAIAIRALDGAPGGLAYVRDLGDGIAKAVFVVDDVEVNLTLCECVEVDDAIAQVAAWASRIAAPEPGAA